MNFPPWVGLYLDLPDLHLWVARIIGVSHHIKPDLGSVGLLSCGCLGLLWSHPAPVAPSVTTWAQDTSWSFCCWRLLKSSWCAFYLNEFLTKFLPLLCLFRLVLFCGRQLKLPRTHFLPGLFAGLVIFKWL
jgi:hypothetical protein